MKMKLLTSLLVSTLAVSAGVQAKIYKFATNTPQDSVVGEIITDFTDRVREKTDNRVNIKMYWSGALGGQNQYVSQIQSGVIDGGLLNSGMLENLQPAIGVINLPYMFRSLDEYADTMGSSYMRQELLAKTKQNDIEVLGYLSNGFRSLYTTKPVNSIADLKGLKIRTMATDTYIKMLENLGAVPVPLDFTEIYGALQQGIVDGAEGVLAGLWEIKFGEVCKYGVRSEQTRLTDFIVLSEKSAQKISAADLKVLREEMKIASQQSVEKVDSSHVLSEKLAVEKMGVKLTSIDKAPFIEAVTPLYDMARKDADKSKAIDAIFAIQGR